MKFIKTMNPSNFLSHFRPLSLFISCLMLYVSPAPAPAQPLPLRPAIRNYPPKEYAAPPQIWCALRDPRGLLYFGTGENILEYDGRTWRKIPVKHGASVRSLTSGPDGTIYVGTDGDFGYLGVSRKSQVISHKFHVPTVANQKDTLPAGTLRYVSLLNRVPESERNFGAIWHTHSCKQGLFFNAKTHLFHYDGQKISVIKPQDIMGADTTGTVQKSRRFFMSFNIQDTLYIQHTGMGLLKYTGKEFITLPGTKGITNKKGIFALLPLNSQNTELLIVTNRDGLWYYNRQQAGAGAVAGAVAGAAAEAGDGLSLQQVTDSKHAFYNATSQPYYGIITQGAQNNEIALATLYNGVYILAPFSPPTLGEVPGLRVLHNFTRESGLQDNRIYNIFSMGATEGATADGTITGGEQILWLCNENGISNIKYPAALSYYSYKDGIEGGVTSILTWHKRLWMATSQGLYYSLRPEIAEEKKHARGGKLFGSLAGISSQCFNLIAYNKGGESKEDVLLVAAGPGGLFEVRNSGLIQPGGYVAKQISEAFSYGLVAESRPGGKIFSGENGLYVSTPTPTGWITKQLLTEEEVKEIVSITIHGRTAGADNSGETELWLGTGYEGLLAVLVGEDNTIREKTWYSQKEGIPAGQIWTFSGDMPFGERGVLLGTNRGLYEIVSTNGLEGGRRKSEGRGMRKDSFNFSKYQIVPCARYGELFAGKPAGDIGSFRQVFRFAEGMNGEVWMSSNGCVHLTKQKGNTYRIDTIPFLNLSEKIDGVYAIHPSPEGTVWFGGTEGLAGYEPGVHKNYKPLYHALVRRVFLGDSVVYNGGSGKESEKVRRGEGEKGGRGKREDGRTGKREYESQNIVSLSYEQNNLKFEFAAPFFEDEEKTEFSYMLEGYDKKWSSWSTDDKANYTNLDPGVYTFRVKAKNIYAHESTVGEYAFEIAPPFYRTWWFYSLEGFMFVLLSGTGLIVRRRDAKMGLRFSRFTLISGTFVGFEYLQYFAETILAGKLILLLIAKTGMSIFFGLIQRPLERLYYKLMGLLREKEKEETGRYLETLHATSLQVERRVRKEIVLNMMSKGLSNEIISEYTGLSAEDVKLMVE